MGTRRKRTWRRRPAIDDREGATSSKALITGMRRVEKRLAAYFVARKKHGNRAGVAFAAVIEKGQRSVAVTEKTQHRRHAIMSTAQPRGKGDIDRCQSIERNHDLAIGREQ